MATPRDEAETPAPSTPERLLSAAWEEYSEHGFAGARIDGIERRAGVNRQLIYRYFGSKEGLFAAVLADSAREHQRGPLPEPGHLGDFLVRQAEQLRTRWDQWLRLLTWEELDHSVAAPDHLAARRETLQRLLGAYREEQERGGIDAGFDVEMLTLFILAITYFFGVYRRTCELVTGLAPDDPRFVERQEAALRMLAEHLAAP